MFELSDQQLLRYSRQILLPQVDVAGQLKLAQGRVLIVGMGGLGAPAALYLAAAGVGCLHLSDFDQVDISNLQRQVLYDLDAIGRAKAAVAAERLRRLNPDIDLHVHQQAMDAETLANLLTEVDLVLDCCDNFATRDQVNRVCVQVGKPLVSAAAVRLEGQLSTFDPRRDDSPCYHCLYGGGDEAALTCSQAGVLGPLVGTMGCLQALEALKLLAGFGEPLVGRLLLMDALTGRFREFRVRRDAACEVCSGR